MRSRLILCLLLASAVALPAAARAQAPAGEPDPNIDLFARKCGSCHTVGSGVRVGPDLKGATDRRSGTWLQGFIKTPSTMLDTDPAAKQLLAQFNGVRMPDLGLTDAEAKGLVGLIQRCSVTPCNLAGSFTPVVQMAADELNAAVSRGTALFLGEQALKNAGAPCLACHTVKGAGSRIGGGLLAKDLTQVYARLGDQGLDAALKSPAFPVMNKVFGVEHPLAPDEVVALRAFFYNANRATAPADDTLSLPVIAFLGTIAVLVALNAAWSRRLRGVRTALTGKNGRIA
ncbi:MAG TPA: cytochrome c [Vicinamibacteria bacterium]|nr:cytochrome c [Vicinamibacteria bacterium]